MHSERNTAKDKYPLVQADIDTILSHVHTMAHPDIDRLESVLNWLVDDEARMEDVTTRDLANARGALKSARKKKMSWTKDTSVNTSMKSLMETCDTIHHETSLAIRAHSKRAWAGLTANTR